MSNLEQLVRPFQSRGIINDKKTRVTRVKSVGTEKAIIRWGSAGDSPETRQVGAKVDIKGSDVKKAYTQLDKKTTNIRVENPDDSNQFVITQRIDEIRFQRPKPYEDNQTGQPTNVPPGNQPSRLVQPETNVSSFSDGSTGTTITKTDSTAVAQNINGNPNAIGTSTAGGVSSVPSERTETDTFVLKWDDVA